MVIWEDIFLNIVKWNGQHINKFDSLQKTQIPFPSWIPEIINLIRWIRNLRCQGTDIACIQRTALKITFQQQKKITGRRWKRKKPGFPRSVCDDQQKRCPIPPWDIFLWGKKNFKVKPVLQEPTLKICLKRILAINIKRLILRWREFSNLSVIGLDEFLCIFSLMVSLKWENM